MNAQFTKKNQDFENKLNCKNKWWIYEHLWAWIWPYNDSHVTYVQLRHLKLQERERVSKDGTSRTASVSKKLAGGTQLLQTAVTDM